MFRAACASLIPGLTFSFFEPFENEQADKALQTERALLQVTSFDEWTKWHDSPYGMLGRSATTTNLGRDLAVKHHTRVRHKENNPTKSWHNRIELQRVNFHSGKFHISNTEHCTVKQNTAWEMVKEKKNDNHQGVIIKRGGSFLWISWDSVLKFEVSGKWWPGMGEKWAAGDVNPRFKVDSLVKVGGFKDSPSRVQLDCSPKQDWLCEMSANERHVAMVNAKNATLKENIFEVLNALKYANDKNVQNRSLVVSNENLKKFSLWVPASTYESNPQQKGCMEDDEDDEDDE